MNTYGYAGGNPIRFSDPEGLIFPALAIPFIGGGSAGLGTFFSASVLFGTVTWAVANSPTSAPEPTTAPAPTLSPQQEARKQREYYRYKNLCDQRPPGGLDPCREALWRYNKWMRCKSARLDWDKRWGEGEGHAGQPAQIQNAIQNAASDIVKLLRYPGMPANPEALTRILAECARASLFPEQSVTDVNQRNIFGDAPLHLASRWGDAEAAEVLLSAGADVNAAGEKGQTPLFAAGNVDVARVLVRAGANLQHRDNDGYTAERFLRVVGKEDVADFLGSQVPMP